VAVAEIEAEQVRIGALVERPLMAARATMSIPVSVAPTAIASAAAPPVPYGSYGNATDCSVLPI